MIQKNDSACADPDSDDGDGFVDIDELLSSVKQESITPSAKPNSGGSPADSTRSTEGSSQGEHLAFPNLARIAYSSDPDPLC
jgi:hypothetical protein